MDNLIGPSEERAVNWVSNVAIERPPVNWRASGRV